MTASTQCNRSENIAAYLLCTLSSAEASALQAHIATCADCRQHSELLRPAIEALTFWPTDVLRPTSSLWPQLAERIAAEAGTKPMLPENSSWKEPKWDEVSPGIFCKLLATDRERARVSMLVRLAPGVEYPPHRHAGTEELHLLHGELWIDDRKLYPGDYNRAELGTADKRVWSETGCTCVLVTSVEDELG